MNKNLFHGFIGKLATGIFTLVLVLSMVCLLDVNGSVAQATDTDYFITEECDGVTITENMVAPKPTTTGKESYIFAGYYTEDTCENPVRQSTDATVYAKFVPADIMSVKVQVLPGTALDSERTDMRLVTTVDGLNYKEVGFDVYFNGATTPVNAKTTTVYKRISVEGESGVQYGYSPTAFADDAEYFTTVNLVNIANKNFDKSFFIKPYWTTLDGTKVYGMSRMARVSDSYNDIVNVPVRLYTTGSVAAGTFDLAYDTDILTYVNYDNGEIYESVTVADDAANKKVTVTTPAEVTDPNGMAVNLRFKVNDGATMPSNTIFAIDSTTFTDAMMADVKYNEFSITYSGTPDTSWYDEFTDGSEFVIATPADLYGLAEIVNDYEGTYKNELFKDKVVKVGADIVINKGTATESGWVKDSESDPLYEWTAISQSGTNKNYVRFSGTFDGQGHTISGIYLYNNDSNNSDFYGLFGITTTSSVIKDFRLENSYFERDAAPTVTTTTDETTNETTTTTTEYQAILGSIAGQPMGTVESVYSSAYVISSNYCTGGLFGRVNSGNSYANEVANDHSQVINNCEFAGTVVVTRPAEVGYEFRSGGIYGWATQGITYIKNCHMSGTVKGILKEDHANSYGVSLGGVIGYFAGKTYVYVENCLVSGDVVVYDARQGEGEDGIMTQLTQNGAIAFCGYNNHSSSQLTIKNSYATQESNAQKHLFHNNKAFSLYYELGETVKDYTAATDTYSLEATYTEEDLKGCDNRTVVSNLGIYTNDKKDDAKYWVITEEGMPELKSFCDEWVDFGWYDNQKTDETDTFVIETAEELYAFSYVSQTDTFSGDTVQLGADIKMNTGMASYWAEGTATPGRQFVPICKGSDAASGKSFLGTFDGKGYEVSGIYVYETANAGNGFFSQSKGTIKNFKLTNSYIVNATSTHNTGAIVGNLRGGSVSNVYADAIVKTTTAKMATGGIVGIASNTSANSTISKCWFNGEVHTNGQYAGGIVGRVLEGTYTIENCLNTGDVNSTREATTAEAGGIAGAINNTKTTIKNCLNTGSVTALEDVLNVGSVVGQITKPTVFENAYTTVNVGDTIVGVGNTTLSTTINGEPALNTNLNGKNAYIYTDFDFASVWACVDGSTPVIADLYDGTEISGLNGQRYSMDWYYNETYYNKSLTNSIDTFTIQNVDDFYGLSKIVNGGHTFKGQTVELVANGNFDLNPDYTVTVDQENGTVTTSGSANKWTPIGTSDTLCFDGTFNGNMNTIKGVYVNGSSGRLGLFGTTGANSLVKNFTIDNSYYTASTAGIAAVAAISSGDFDNIYMTDSVGIVSTYNGGNNGRAAGIVAYWQGSNAATISNCWFDGYVSAYRRYASGIAGQIYNGTKTIENCLFTGTVEGMSSNAMFHGGLAGAIMGSSTVSPTVYLKNSVVTGTVKAMTANAVGSVVGRAITSGQANNSDKVYLYVENVYTTDDLVHDDSVTLLTNNNYRMNGCGDLTTQYNYTFGEPMIVDTTELAGLQGYINTDLDFASKWVATNDCPKLTSFATADVTDFTGVQRVSISWYYNAAEYSLSSLDKTNKYANQLNTEYELFDVADMYGFAAIVNGDKLVYGETDLFADKTVKLVNDIIFNNVTTGNEAAGWADGSITAPTTSWVPIGTEDGKNNFQGTFDGDGHAIKGLYVASNEEYLGLFRKIQDATICNLDLVNSYFVCTEAEGSASTIMGSIAGGGDGTLENIYSNAIVKGQRLVGGIIGRVSHSSNTDTELNVNSCWFNGVLDIDYKGSSRNYSGGIVGYPVHGTTTIDTCLYTGTIDFDVNYTGTGGTYGPQIGGICSGDNGESDSNVITKNSLSAGEIHSTVLTCEKNPGLTYIGSVYGDVRRGTSSAENTFALTTMTDTKESTGATTTRTATYYASKSNGQVVAIDQTFMGNPEVMYGLGAQMWTELLFTAEDRLVADDIELEEGQVASEVAGPIWAAIAGDIPVPATLAENALSMTVGKPNTELTGSGTQADPWKITTVEELAGFAELSKSKTFAGEYVVLANDIIINSGEDASKWVDDTAEPTLPWNTSIGYEGTSGTDGKRFEGTFDGQGHTISGICYENASKDTTEYVGLFATTEVGSTVKNLRLKNSYFEQVGSGYTGSIIGDCRGTVSNVYSDAIVKTSDDQAGGIVGRVNGYDYVSHKAGTESRTSQTIENCWYDGDIILVGEARYGGGIIGIFIQGEWTLNNCVFTGTITQEYNGTSHAYVGGLCGALNTPGSSTTSTKESTLNLNSCISAGTIKTTNNGNGAGALVGRLKANVEFNETTENDVTTTTFKRLEASNLVINNVFTTREAGHQEVGSYGGVTETDTAGNEYTANPSITGTAVWTNNADRLVGYCTEETKTDYYDGGSLDFTSTFVIREEGVPVPATFTDMDNVTQVATSNLNTILALTTMDSTWSLENAVNYGLGHYVLTSTGKTYDNYTAYLTALEAQGFTPYTTLDETGTDGVYNVIYTRATGEWVLNVLFVQNTGEVTLTISNGLDSLSPDLEPETSTTSGDVTVSMLQLEGSKASFNSSYYQDYYYGNSFVFKLPNGHFIINDGGNKSDAAGLMAYLRKEAGLAADDTTSKIYVDAWTITHQHGDHLGIMREFVSTPSYAQQLVVNAIYLNEPNQKAMLCYASDTNVMNTVKNQYRGMRMLKDANGNMPKVYWCQTGQTYYFDGLTMDILQSQEQIPVTSYGKRNVTGSTGTDYNTVSTNMLFTTANGKKVLITGDSNYVNMEWIMDAYGTSSQTLAGLNVYQVLHHGKNTSYNIASEDNTFTDYLLGMTTSGKFDVTLFPCSVIYEYEGNHESYVFPAAGAANEYLVGKSTTYYDYGDGTIKITLGDTITSGLDQSVDTGTDNPEIEEGETGE